MQGRRDLGLSARGSASPPQGGKLHRHHFTPYALKPGSIPLDKEAPAAMVRYCARATAPGSASLFATCGHRWVPPRIEIQWLATMAWGHFRIGSIEILV